MSTKLLIPSYSSFIPSSKQREHASQINKEYPLDRFDNASDWFFFFHIDPVQRFIHTFGMGVGSIFFAWAIWEWSLLSFLLWGIGVFFFYCLGVISHAVYDKTSAPVERSHLVTTFWPVTLINLHTAFGVYDRQLRQFVEKYPFTVQAHSLIEIERKNLVKHLLRQKD